MKPVDQNLNPGRPEFLLGYRMPDGGMWHVAGGRWHVACSMENVSSFLI